MPSPFGLRWQSTTVAPAILFLVLGGLACGTNKDSGAAVPFPLAKVHFEQNATDQDMEVVFEATGDADGLVELSVVAPDGRTVVDFKSPQTEKYGIRGFRFESPEPSAVDALKAAFPEGAYAFAGKAASGESFTGQATLSHALPAVATFRNPAEEAEDVPVTGLELSWGAAAGAAFYIVEIEQDQLNVNLTLRVPSSVTKIGIPDGFLAKGTEYTMLLGTADSAGNESFVETTFTTAE